MLSSMTIGMLWFDNDPKASLNDKIARAVEHYQKKYGQRPNLCYVHPSMLPEESRGGPVEVKTNRFVQPNHLWIGIQS